LVHSAQFSASPDPFNPRVRDLTHILGPILFVILFTSMEIGSRFRFVATGFDETYILQILKLNKKGLQVHKSGMSRIEMELVR